MRITRTDLMALSVVAASGLVGFAVSAWSFSGVERRVTITTEWQSVGDTAEGFEQEVLRFEDSSGRIQIESVDRRPRSEATRFETDASSAVEGREMQWQRDENVESFRDDSRASISSRDTDVSLQPLIYIDGERTERDISELSPDDIERVEVVKGAAARELFGDEAEGGVIQIFTKKSMTRLPGN